MNPRPLRHVDLFSDAGRLEALYRDIPDARASAVVCHPHPLHGGTLHNKVVFRAARGLESAGVATVRFNFRGVGTSQGRHDSGEGEQRDFEAAMRWIRKHHPRVPFIAGGFSFGSWVASRYACDAPEVAAIFMIGAPVNKYSLAYLNGCNKRKLILQGSEDQFGDPEKLGEMVSSWPDAELIVVDGADHFFARQIDVVEQTMRLWADELLD